MNLTFEQLRLKNVKSYIGDHAVNFDRVGIGLHFLCGSNQVNKRLESNGAGKSTLFDALLFCLFGKTAKGLRGGDIRPWSGAHPTAVSVQFRCADSVHKIERTVSPSSLTLDGRDCAQETIDRLLRLNYDTFTHTVSMGQGQPLFFDLTPTKKLEMFSAVLNLDRWDERADRASLEHKNIEIKIAQNKAAIETNQGMLDKISEIIIELTAKAKDWDAENRDAARNIDAELTALQRQIDDLEKLRGEEDLKGDSAGLLVRNLKTEADLLDKRWAQAVQRNQEYISRKNTLGRDRENLEKSLRNLDKDPSKCPTCGQPLVSKAVIEQHRQEIKEQLSSTHLAIEELRVPPSPDPIRTDLLNKRVEISQAESVEREHEREMNRFQSQIGSLRSKISFNEKRREEIEKTGNPHREQLKIFKEKKERFVATLFAQTIEIQALTVEAERTKFWVKGFREIRLYVVDQVLEELELATNSLLQDVGLEDWAVKYVIEKETKEGKISRGLNVFIHSPANKEPVRWEVWSGGEGQRLRLCGSLALSEILLNHAGVIPNLEIIDEPSRGMTSGGVQELVDYLKDRAHQLSKVIFFVDHLAYDSNSFDSVLTVTKTKKGSELTLPY